MKTFLPTLFIALFASAAVHAADKQDHNSHLWLNYVGDHPIGDGPWGVHLESQVRRADFGKNWQQFMVRPGVNYAFTPALSASLGYAYVETHPYGDYPALDTFPEHRIWQQLIYTHKEARRHRGRGGGARRRGARGVRAGPGATRARTSPNAGSPAGRAGAGGTVPVRLGARSSPVAAPAVGAARPPLRCSLRVRVPAALRN